MEDDAAGRMTGRVETSAVHGSVPAEDAGGRGAVPDRMCERGPEPLVYPGPRRARTSEETAFRKRSTQTVSHGGGPAA